MRFRKRECDPIKEMRSIKRKCDPLKEMRYRGEFKGNSWYLRVTRHAEQQIVQLITPSLEGMGYTLVRVLLDGARTQRLQV